MTKRPREGHRRFVSARALRWAAVAALGGGVLALALGTALRQTPEEVHAGQETADDTRAEAAEYIARYHALSLTPSQAEMRKEALSAIPAPCCQEYSIETCCCPCNLAKSVWGLAASLIVEQGYDAPQVTAAVKEWLRSTNERGYSGDACFQGGCERPFHENGCGGMDEERIS
ncbi:MAG: hypothetical protein AB1505_00700 [Candidatus Latescibacterota bacterium]